MEPIAIVGFAFRLPGGAIDVENFLEIVENGKNTMTDWPEDRVNLASFHDVNAGKPNTIQARGGHFLNEHPASFDAPFFSINAKEAIAMDPQQRMILETSFRALENAGIPVAEVAGSNTAVYEASMVNDYYSMILKDMDNLPRMAATGTANAILANRVSWYFNFHGPSVHIDTACSGSLVGIDLACTSLRSGESSMALVAGSNLMLSPEAPIMLSRMNFLSPDSLCYSFDSRANGYSRGEGVIVMVLKRLSDAIESGDTIRALIRASGVNQDGHTPGLTQPSSYYQEKLIRSVYQKAGLDFRLTRYVEAHGTGTPLGDPLEIQAIGRVFRTERTPDEPLFVGSVKANIGHLEGASGLAGLLKSVLALERGTIPPVALFAKANPDLDLEFYNIEIPTQAIAWPCDGARRISVNSFGFGGTNAHVVLDDAHGLLAELSLRGLHCTLHRQIPQVGIKQLKTNMVSGNANGTTHVNGTKTPIEDKDHSNGMLADVPIGSCDIPQQMNMNGFDLDRVASKGLIDSASQIPKPSKSDVVLNKSLAQELKLLVWSASDEGALGRMIEQYSAYYRLWAKEKQHFLRRLANTLSERRSNMLWRAFTIAPSDELKMTLGGVSKPYRSSRTGLAFVFTGQGAQYAGMGLHLLRYPKFECTLTEIDSILAEFGCPWSILDKLKQSDSIDRPEYSQVICTALQIALMELLKYFGLVPSSVIGHSSGEIAAAHTTGAISLHSAVKIAYYRGVLADKLSKMSSIRGSMMSVNLAEDEVKQYLVKRVVDDVERGSITVACINSPGNVTLSGAETTLEVLKKSLDEDGVFAHKLSTGIAYHSPAMEEIASEYESLVGEIRIEKPGNSSVLMISTVTGKPVSTNDLSQSRYWSTNLVSPVKFCEGLRNLINTDSKLQLGVKRSKPIYDLVEIGPHGALRRPCLDTIAGSGKEAEIRYSTSLSRNKSSDTSLLTLLGSLFTYGYSVEIAKVNNQDDDIQRDFLVDTPAYPFDHSQRYWHESRLSYNYRMKGTVPRDVLGSRVWDWNPLEPKWRKIIDSTDLRWVHDHVVDGNLIYPATGMLIMAIEAAKQAVPEVTNTQGFFIKEAEFKSPITLRLDSDGEGRVETLISLFPMHNASEKHATWFRTTIATCHDDSWVECFSCTIQVQTKEAPNAVDGGKEKHLEHQAALSTYNEALKSCTRPIGTTMFYDFCRERGISYGPSFSILKDIRSQDGCTSIGKIDVSLPNSEYQGLVHPAIIDAACQVSWLAPTKGLTEKIATTIPRRIRNVYVAASGWKSPQTSHVRIVATAHVKPVTRGIEGSIIILSDDGRLLAKVGQLELAPIADEIAVQGSARKLLHGIQWKPALSMLSPERLSSICESDTYRLNQSIILAFNFKFQSIICFAMKKALDTISDSERLAAPPHLQKYISWMERSWKKHEKLVRKYAEHGLQLEDLLVHLEAEKSEWAVYYAVARNLVGILRGQVDPLQLMFSADELAERLYADIFASICDQRFLTFLDLASHENPNLRILEVGAGTGGFTSHVLQALGDLEQKYGGTRFSRYVYTDVSPGYFDNARVKFSTYASRMEYKVLDLERDLASQGFDLDSFDLVIAGSVIHTTKDLRGTLSNIRGGMKSGGRLLFFEVTGPDALIIQFGFGTLPGWWNGIESWRDGDQDQITSEQQWHDLLLQTGFSGNDLVLRDNKDDECHSWGILVSTATQETENQMAEHNIMLLHLEDSDCQEELAQALTQSSLSETCAFQKRYFGDSSTLVLDSISCLIVLLDVGKPFLGSMTESEFMRLRFFIQKVPRVLFVTSRNISNHNYALAATSTGFLRALRSETSSHQLISLDLEGLFVDVKSSSETIIEVFRRSFQQSSNEVEYILRDGVIRVGRLKEEKPACGMMSSIAVPSLKSERWSDGPALKLDMERRGMLDTLRFVEDTDTQNDLDPDDIEIDARSWGVGFRDVFIALGRLEANDFGQDTAGYVTRVGSNCQSLQVGDRVVIIKCGSMRQYPRCHYLDAIKIPDSMSFEDAASLPVPAATAYYCLVKIAHLSKGEKILIHSATGATGQMSCQLARSVGAEVFATVGTEEKKQILISLGIDEDHIFYSRDTTFAQGIKRMTNGYGVDVAINSLSGDKLRATWECMAPFGRFLEIGKADIAENASLPMNKFENNVSFHAVDLRHLFAERKEIQQFLLQTIMKLQKDGTITFPQPRRVFSVSAIEEAYRLMQSGKHTGRIVINTTTSEVVSKYITSPREWRFAEDASYIIAGGLGGVGRGICRWMMRKGVKNLILPSRSGPKTDTATTLLNELRQGGVTVVAPVCDVSSRQSLSELIESCSASMPPIKGCINAAMSLQDSVFDNMTYEQWVMALQSKVPTSMNLHDLLPRNLDFFILLSSLAGIFGNVSQCNYAAGNTFQDALAYHRTSQGQKALSINLGWMRTIGIISEREEYQHFRMHGADMAQIEEEEFMAVLDMYCDPSHSILRPSDSQLLMGTITPAVLQEHNVDVPEIMERPLFSTFSTYIGGTKAENTEADDSRLMFSDATTDDARIDVVVQSLAKKLARSLSMAVGDVDTSRPLFDYGVDSLVAVEIRNWIGKEFFADVAVFDIMGGASINAVGALVSEKSSIKIKS